MENRCTLLEENDFRCYISNADLPKDSPEDKKVGRKTAGHPPKSIHL